MNKENIVKEVSSIIGALVLLVVAGTVVVLAFIQSNKYLEIKERETKNNAVSECLEFSGRYEYVNKKDNTSGYFPQKEIYKVCLKDKGYESLWE